MVKKGFVCTCCFSLCVLFVAFLMPVSASYAETTKNPLVAIEPIRCDSPSQAYVGKALSEMLITRLSSEDIDTVLVGRDKASVVELSDFVLSGRVNGNGGRFEAKFQLKSPKSEKVVKEWSLVAPNLGMLAQKASLLSAKMADTIKHTGEVLVADTVSSFATLAGPGSKKIKTNDEFEMARLHPDILVRERLEKDEEREIRQQKAGRSSGGNRPVATSEDDSYMPLPDVYDAGDDVPEGEIQGDQGPKSASMKKEEEDDSSFFPLPDVYDPDDDENAVDAPKKEPVNTVAEAASSEKHPENASGSSAEAKKEKKSWYSWLWPFGGKEEKNKVPSVSQAKETRLQKEREDKEPVVVSASEKLPVPAPPQVEFNIPEPVPLDQALSQIENIKVEKKEERGWLSWIWPWGNHEEEQVVKTASTTVPKQGVQQPPESGLHSFDSGAEIEALRRHLEMQRGLKEEVSPSDAGSSSTEQPSPSVESGQEVENGPASTGESPKATPEQVQGPIWQWN